MFESQYDAAALCDECTEPFDHSNHANDGAWPNHRFVSIGARRDAAKSSIDRVYDERTQTVTLPEPADEMWRRAVNAVRLVPSRTHGRADRMGQALAILSVADRPLSVGAISSIISSATGEQSDALHVAVSQSMDRLSSQGRATKAKCRIRGGRSAFCYEATGREHSSLSTQHSAPPAAPIGVEAAPATAPHPAATPATPGGPNPYKAVLDHLQERADRLNAELLGIENAIRVVQRLSGASC